MQSMSKAHHSRKPETMAVTLGPSELSPTYMQRRSRFFIDSLAMLILCIYISVTIWHLPFSSPENIHQLEPRIKRSDPPESLSNNPIGIPIFTHPEFFILVDPNDKTDNSSCVWDRNYTSNQTGLNIWDVHVKPVWNLSADSYPWDFYCPEPRDVCVTYSLSNLNGTSHYPDNRVDVIMVTKPHNSTYEVHVLHISQSNTSYDLISTSVLWYSSRPFPDIPLLILCGALIVYGAILAAKWKKTFTLDLLLFSVTACTAGFRLFLNVRDPIGENITKIFSISDLEIVTAIPPRLAPLESTIMWLVWHNTVTKIERWTLLLVTLRIFAGFGLRFLHLIFIFAFVFTSIAYIGWLGLGDLLDNISTLQDALLCQFGMISSDYPSDLKVESRIFLFTLWLLANACVVFCGIYNFYQALLETGYDSRMWFGSHWFNEPHKSDSSTMHSYDKSYTEFDDDTMFDRMNHLLEFSDRLNTWLCIYSAGTPKKTRLTDRELISAIGRSFSEITVQNSQP